MVNVLIFAIIAAIVGASGWYVVREKRRGKKCIGCPDSGSCPHSCNCSANH